MLIQYWLANSLKLKEKVKQMNLNCKFVVAEKTAHNEAVGLVVPPIFYSKTASYGILVAFCNSLYYIELANLNPLSSHEKILQKFIKTDFSDSLNRIVYAPPPEAAPGFSRLGHYVPTAPSPTFQPAANLAVCFMGGLEHRKQSPASVILALQYAFLTLFSYIIRK
jgi:hypothetical protein